MLQVMSKMYWQSILHHTVRECQPCCGIVQEKGVCLFLCLKDWQKTERYAGYRDMRILYWPQIKFCVFHMVLKNLLEIFLPVSVSTV